MEIIEDEKHVCKGLYFRAYNSQWKDYSREQRYAVRQDIQLRLLKKASCKGCETCELFWEYLQDTEDRFDLSEIEKGKIYTPMFRELNREYETGCLDDWDYYFCGVEELF